MHSNSRIGLSILDAKILNLGAIASKATINSGFMLVTIFDIEIIKTITSFLIISDKSLSIDFFYHNSNIW